MKVGRFLCLLCILYWMCLLLFFCLWIMMLFFKVFRSELSWVEILMILFCVLEGDGILLLFGFVERDFVLNVFKLMMFLGLVNVEFCCFCWIVGRLVFVIFGFFLYCWGRLFFESKVVVWLEWGLYGILIILKCCFCDLVFCEILLLKLLLVFCCFWIIFCWDKDFVLVFWMKFVIWFIGWFIICVVFEMWFVVKFWVVVFMMIFWFNILILWGVVEWKDGSVSLWLLFRLLEIINWGDFMMVLVNWGFFGILILILLDLWVKMVGEMFCFGLWCLEFFRDILIKVVFWIVGCGVVVMIGFVVLGIINFFSVVFCVL